MTTAMTAPTISTAELKGLLLDESNAPLLLDVRTPGEFETGHIVGSVNIPLDELGEFCPRVAGLDRDVVVICQSGSRANTAQSKLAETGCDSARVLVGGMNSWTGAGGDVNVVAERWAMDRQVRLTAGSLVLAGFAASRAVTPKAIWFSAAIGGGLVFSAVSNTCAMANVLSRLPYNRASSRTDIDEALTTS